MVTITGDKTPTAHVRIVAWASVHDWYLDHSLVKPKAFTANGEQLYNIVVRDDDPNTRPDAYLTFVNYNSLKEWAGY